jgi:hypothetical protein
MDLWGLSGYMSEQLGSFSWAKMTVQHQLRLLLVSLQVLV